MPSGTDLLKVYAMNDVGTALPVKPRALGLDKQTITGLTLGVLPDDVAPPMGHKARAAFWA